MEQAPPSAEMLRKSLESPFPPFPALLGFLWGGSAILVPLSLQNVLAASGNFLEDLKSGVNVSLPSALFSGQVSDGNQGIYPQQ